MDLSEHYNIYCDESCHLENDHQKVMTLGAVWCATEKVKEISVRIREKKIQYGLKVDFELKWTKVSPAKESFYMDIVDSLPCHKTTYENEVGKGIRGL